MTPPRHRDPPQSDQDSLLSNEEPLDVPRDHGRILTRAWNSGAFKGVPREAFGTFAMLVSEPSTNNAGLVSISLNRWANNFTSSTPVEIRADLELLASERFIVVDWDTEEILIRTLVRNDGICKQPFVLINALRAAILIQSPTLRSALSVELRRLKGHVGDLDWPLVLAAADMLDGHRPPDPNVFRAGNRKGSTKPSQQGFDIPSLAPFGKGVGVGEGVAVTTHRTEPFVDGSVGEAPSQAKPPTKRGTRIPDDFHATPTMIAWAKDNTPHVGHAETAQFVDYWQAESGAKATKHNWVQAWQVWMRRAQRDAERYQNRRPAPDAAPSAPQSGSRRVDKAMTALDPDDPFLAQMTTSTALSTPDAAARFTVIEGGRSA